MDFKTFLKNAANVKPSKQQLFLLREMPFYAFVHFSPNTYTNLEWGDGTEDPAIFNPTDLDCEQWAKAIKAAGMKGMVLTAKHHDGFCLWQTKYTEHSMKNSPYKNGKGDIVKEASEACKKYGLKFGFYLSPWDRNSKYYGTDEYNTYYKNQLTELLTNYGEIFHVWFDGACGEGPNGKKQVYDFEGYFELIKKYQPNATVFNDKGNIRWCGNEAGKAPFAQWAVVPYELCPFCEKQTDGALMEGSIEGIYNPDTTIGSLANIMYSKGLVFAPSETDMSIRPGWFYHENEEPHSPERLFNTYINTVGNNSTFHLNIPPMPNGKLNDKDIQRLKELGEKINNCFGKVISEDAIISIDFSKSETQPTITVKLPEKRELSFVELAEKIENGQRVESFILKAKNDDGAFGVKYYGTTIGSRKIVPLDESIITDKLLIEITSARDIVEIEWVKLY